MMPFDKLSYLSPSELEGMDINETHSNGPLLLTFTDT